MLEKAHEEAEQLQKQLSEMEAGKIEAQKQAAQKEPAEIPAKEEIKDSDETAIDMETKGICDCCGRSSIKTSEMVRIDSGQLFCPDCLKAFRGG